MACTQAQLLEQQQQLTSATEDHGRQTGQLQAALRQARADREADAQELKGVREELQGLRERHEGDAQRLTRRHDGLLRVRCQFKNRRQTLSL